MYPEKIPDDELQKMPQTKARKFKLQARLEPAQQHLWQARKADVLTVISHVAPCRVTDYMYMSEAFSRTGNISLEHVYFSYPQGLRCCCLLVCLTSQQHASVSQGRICSYNFTCYHSEIEVTDQTFHLTQSQYTDTAWQGSHWSASFKSLVWLDLGKIPAQAGFEPSIFCSRGGCLNH